MGARIDKAKYAKAKGATEQAAGDKEWVSHLEQVVTLEIALYLVATALGAALRLLLLDARPLSVEEGALALESHRLAAAQRVETLQQGPLLAFGTALSLIMFGGGDAAARLLPALFGSALVVAPFLMRESLGRTPALMASYGVALSPLMLFASRDLGGGMVPLTLGIFLLAVLDRGFKDATRLRAYGAALLLAGLVASGVEGATILVTLGVAAALAHPRPGLLLASLQEASASPLWRRAALLFVAVALALATGLGTRLGGAQSVVVDIWADWLGSFSLSAPQGGLLAHLALYEMPVLALGLAQLFRTMFRRHRVDMFLSLWLMLLLLLGMMQHSSSVSRVVLPALPLYLLAARLVSDSYALARHAGRGWRWSTTSLAVAIPTAVAIVLLNRASTPGMEIPTPYLYGEAALAIVAVLAFAFLLRGLERLALVWHAIAILSVGFLIHTTSLLNYQTETVAREPLVGSQTSIHLRDAALEAAYYSTYYFQRVTVDPELKAATQWYLREARDVRYTSEASDGISIGLVRPSQTKLEPSSERRAGLYVPSLDPRGLSWRGVWSWLVTRDGLVRANQRDIIIRAPAGNW